MRTPVGAAIKSRPPNAKSAPMPVDHVGSLRSNIAPRSGRQDHVEPGEEAGVGRRGPLEAEGLEHVPRAQRKPIAHPIRHLAAVQPAEHPHRRRCRRAAPAIAEPERQEEERLGRSRRPNRVRARPRCRGSVRGRTSRPGTRRPRRPSRRAAPGPTRYRRTPMLAHGRGSIGQGYCRRRRRGARVRVDRRFHGARWCRPAGSDPRPARTSRRN